MVWLKEPLMHGIGAFWLCFRPSLALVSVCFCKLEGCISAPFVAFVKLLTIYFGLFLYMLFGQYFYNFEPVSMVFPVALTGLRIGCGGLCQHGVAARTDNCSPVWGQCAVSNRSCPLSATGCAIFSQYYSRPNILA